MSNPPIHNVYNFTNEMISFSFETGRLPNLIHGYYNEYLSISEIKFIP